MQDILVVIDMQNDFIDGALGTPQACAIVPRVKKRIDEFEGRVVFTQDTHETDYLSTREGKKLPVEHCVRNTPGWQIRQEILPGKDETRIEKPTFASVQLGEWLRDEDEKEAIGTVTLVGLCTDICVISNAFLIRAFLPETEIVVDASCCAGVSPETHQVALQAMENCQITIVNSPQKC